MRRLAALMIAASMFRCGTDTGDDDAGRLFDMGRPTDAAARDARDQTDATGSRDAHVEDAAASDAGFDDVRASDARLDDATASDAQIADVAARDAGFADAFAADSQLADATADDAEVADALTTDALPSDAIPVDTQSVDAFGADAMADDATSTDVEFSDTPADDDAAFDAGFADAFTPDAHLADAASMDAEFVDSASLDAGFEDASGPAPDVGPADAGSFAVTVTDGYGDGIYNPGDLVHVFSSAVPGSTYHVQWQSIGATPLRPAEWHTTFTMPANDVTVSAQVETRSVTLTESFFAGSTALPKRVRWFIPNNPRALMLMLHGTGGSAEFIRRTESRAVVLAAVERGYAVLSYEAEEVQAGDLNGDMKIRWDAGVTTNNVDFANLDALIADMRNQGFIPPAIPTVVMGMSNGGSMSLSLGAITGVPAVAAQFSNLRFAAAASHCASGRITSAALTTTPTAWYLCRQDMNPSVGMQGNLQAESFSAALANRGVATEVIYHEPSPLYDERFTRIDGITPATSMSIVQELRTAGFVGGDGYLDAPPADITAAYVANPNAFPTIRGVTPTQRLEITNQIGAVFADHAFFADLAEAMLDFLDRFI